MRTGPGAETDASLKTVGQDVEEFLMTDEEEQGGQPQPIVRALRSSRPGSRT